MNDDNRKSVKRFTCKQKLGSGAYSSVHSCIDESGKEFAVKVENSAALQPALMNERCIYFHIVEICNETKQSYPRGIPVVYHYAEKKAKGIRFIIMERLGASLLDVMKQLGRSFTAESVLTIGLQMVERFRVLHGFGVIHRDVKPDNILSGMEPEKKAMLHITDFGIATIFKDTSSAYSPSQSDAFEGLHMFSSHRAHRSLPQSERDDLESLLYSLVFLAKGELPWEKEKDGTQMGVKKASISANELCHGLPASIESFGNSVRALDFMETPDYEGMKSLFEKDLEITCHTGLDWE